MKITVESTTRLVTLCLEGGDVPARLWQGTAEDGTPVHAYITRIVPEVPVSDPDIAAHTAAFEAELLRCAEPRAPVAAIPLRMIL